MSSSRWECGPIYDWHYDYYMSGDAPDGFARFEAEGLADELCSTGANLVVVFALNQHGYAYYPSAVAPAHPSLGQRDYTGSMIDALHRRGVKVITYVNYMNIDQRAAHPEWWQRTTEGDQVYEAGWGVPCPNGPIRPYMRAIVTEVAERYPTDGFFFDMFGFNRSGCWCENCRMKFGAQYNMPYPIREDWGSESWRRLVEFRHASAVEMMTEVRDAAKAVRPELVWITHTSPLSPWYRGTDALSPEVDDVVHTEVSTRWGKGRWVAGEMSKLLRAYGRGKPRIVCLADLHMYWDKPKGWFYIPYSSTQLRLQVASIVAHGAWPAPYTEPYPDGRNNPYTVQGIREAFGMARQMEPYLVGAEPVKSVALHFSRPTYDFWAQGDPSAYLQGFHGMYKALMESHIPFDVVVDEQIVAGGLDEYALCVLSNSACTSEAVNAALLQYVRAGGSLLATYKTSLYDEYGRQRHDFGLQEAFGARYVAEFQPAYMRVSGALAEGMTGSPIIQQRLLRVEALDGSSVPGTLIAPSPTDLAPFTYVSAPSQETSWPSMVQRGRAIYVAADMGYTFMRASYLDHVRLAANCVGALAGERLPLRVKAPSTVDVALARQGDRYLVHLVNMTTNQVVEDEGCNADTYEVIPVHELELRLQLGSAPRQVYRAADGTPLPWRSENKWTVVEVPRLELYEIVVLETAGGEP
jgi:hypothetical protein